MDGRSSVINIFSQNVPESSSITTEDKNIILKAYSTQKVGSGGNYESGNQVLRRMVYFYLIKLTQQKDANLILTRKCFTIAKKTIQLSSHITQHDEFIKATFSSEIFFETNNIFAIPFLFHYVREDKKPNRGMSNYTPCQKRN